LAKGKCCWPLTLPYPPLLREGKAFPCVILSVAKNLALDSSSSRSFGCAQDKCIGSPQNDRSGYFGKRLVLPPALRLGVEGSEESVVCISLKRSVRVAFGARLAAKREPRIRAGWPRTAFFGTGPGQELFSRMKMEAG
jgi:hypothetical protein